MPHILIVEDEGRMAATLEKGLKQVGFDTTIVNNGLVARSMQINQFDLIILDWLLPGISGVDLLRHWRLQNFQTPIIMLTAKSEIHDKVTGLDFGADDYLSKFFEWPELVARIHALLRRVDKNTTNIGSIALDRIRECFLENGSVVELTPTEYSILKYFFDRPGRLITRSSLVMAIYRDGQNPFSNVIERHVKSIRQKFKYDPIQTIRGLGYRLHTSSTVSSD